jgi:hypothetical protein
MRRVTLGFCNTFWMPTRRCAAIWSAFVAAHVGFARDLEIAGNCNVPALLLGCCGMPLAFVAVWVAAVHVVIALFQRQWNGPSLRALALLAVLVPMPWLRVSWVSHGSFLLRWESSLDESRRHSSSPPGACCIWRGTDPDRPARHCRSLVLVLLRLGSVLAPRPARRFVAQHWSSTMSATDDLAAIRAAWPFPSSRPDLTSVPGFPGPTYAREASA